MLNKKYLPLLVVLFWLAHFIVDVWFTPPGKDLYEQFEETSSSITKAQISKNYEQAEMLSQKAVEDAESRNDDLEKVIFLKDLARIYEMAGKDSEAEKTLLKIINFIEEKRIQNREADSYYDLALFYFKRKRCDEAIALARKHLDWQEFADGTANTETYRLGKRVLRDSEQKHCSQ